MGLRRGVCLLLAWCVAPANAAAAPGGAPHGPLFLRLGDLRRRAGVQEANEWLFKGQRLEVGLVTRLLERGPRGDARPSCDTCAVVGAAGSLRGAGQGAEIDGHDCVFRVNNAVTRGHEKDVGTRTTVHVWAMPATKGNLGERQQLMRQQALLMRHSQASSNASVLYLNTNEVARRIWELDEEAGGAQLPWDRLRLLHPSQLRALCRQTEVCVTINGVEQRPTTGFVTAWLAQQLCAEPRIYGFDSHSVPFHYYDPPDEVCDAEFGARLRGQGIVHNWGAEQLELLRWHREGRVRLSTTNFSAPPDVSRCAVADAFRMVCRHERWAGIWRVQPYHVNGKVVYELRDKRGIAEKTWVLYYTRCQGDYTGAWVIMPHPWLAEGQARTPGEDGRCVGMAMSHNFRPENPVPTIWLISTTEGFQPDPSFKVQLLPWDFK